MFSLSISVLLLVFCSVVVVLCMFFGGECSVSTLGSHEMGYIQFLIINIIGVKSALCDKADACKHGQTHIGFLTVLDFIVSC